MTGPAPSVGRIVHYVARGSADGRFPPACRAAIVTEVGPHPDADGTVGLCALNPSGLFFHPLEMGGVAHAEDKAAGAEEHPPGTWHWPERVGL